MKQPPGFPCKLMDDVVGSFWPKKVVWVVSSTYNGGWKGWDLHPTVITRFVGVQPEPLGMDGWR